MRAIAPVYINIREEFLQPTLARVNVENRIYRAPNSLLSVTLTLSLQPTLFDTLLSRVCYTHKKELYLVITLLLYLYVFSNTLAIELQIIP